MKIRRQLAWRSQLLLFAEERIGQSFQWGESDCATIARGALETMFGRDAVPFLPRWQNAREALEALEAVGSFAKVLERLGAVQTTPSFMRSGDLIIQTEPDEEIGRECVLVCIDGRRCLSSSHDGVFVQILPNALPQPRVYSLWELVVDG